MTRLGYLRVSTHEQRPDRQIDALEAACDELFIEISSAISPRRPVFDTVMAELSAGDTLVILDLDRAFRSVVDAVNTLEDLKAREVDLKILNLQIDTTTPSGMLIYTILSAFAEFERRILSQRTKEGLAAARKRGKRVGRRPKLTKAELEQARRDLAAPEATTAKVAAQFGVAPWSLLRSLRRQRDLQRG